MSGEEHCMRRGDEEKSQSLPFWGLLCRIAGLECGEVISYPANFDGSMPGSVTGGRCVHRCLPGRGEVTESLGYDDLVLSFASLLD
jgi:hypothetical protein